MAQVIFVHAWLLTRALERATDALTCLPQRADVEALLMFFQRYFWPLLGCDWFTCITVFLHGRQRRNSSTSRKLTGKTISVLMKLMNTCRMKPRDSVSS